MGLVEGLGIPTGNSEPLFNRGFMSQCEWNSCLESITMGEPIAALPMHSDQPRNTVLTTQMLKVGLVVKH